MPAESVVQHPKRRIGRYLVTGRIGRGGMGMVYRGLDEALERELAIKTLTVEGTFDAESRARFEIEAKAAAKLQHPNILTVFELGEDRGIPFIAMELLPGEDLESLLRAGAPLLLCEKLDIMVQVCRGLAFAHDRGIVHRDIKPSNIRLLDDGTVKIMDFGIAKLSGTNLTKSGMMVGTVHYMSPEQIRGRALDGRSDVFSAGVILHELLSGERPFVGVGATAILYKIIHEPAPPLPDLGEVTASLQEIVARALAKDPEARFPGAAAMADDLERARRTHPLFAEAPLAAQDLEVLNQARRLLKESRLDEGERRLRDLADRNPSCVEAQRALRVATRETQRRRRPLEAEPDAFPELEATFQAPPTASQPETAFRPTVHLPPPAEEPPPAPGPPSRGLLFAVGTAVLAVVAATGLLFWPRPGSEVRVRSRPPGAHVLVDGQDTGLLTDAEVSLPASGQHRLTLRKPGYREEARTLSLPLARGEAITLDLAPAAPVEPPAFSSTAVSTEPQGAAVSLDGQRVGTTPVEVRFDASGEHRLAVTLEGYAAQELRLQAGKVPPELRVVLEPSGPPGTVSVTSAFPLDVLWRGKVLAKGQASPRVSLPAGRQTLTLVSPVYFLRSTLNVEVRGGADSAVEAPGLGRVSIRANPDNCQVFIDGSFVDYPPILDKPVAVGTHAVVFKWPDGSHHGENAEIHRGALAYVMGRKD